MAETTQDLDDAAFELFADVYPHEAYGQDPERFWGLFHLMAPTVSREEMEALLHQPAPSQEHEG